MKKILIVGNGGREHAISWNLANDPNISKVVNIPYRKNFAEVLNLIKKESVGLTIIGPEGPLADGIVDFLNSQGVRNVFGPTRKMARIESDKFYSYELMGELGIPQANSVRCVSVGEVEDAIKEFEEPVLKCRGLARGKGVRVYSSQEKARMDLSSFVKEFGEEILVAERLRGQEFSVFGIADGENVLPFDIAFQDHKPVYDGDKGPNTGGMGAYGPVEIAPKKLVNKIAEDILMPIVRKINYKGFIYAGMMLTDKGLKVIEFNARFGDPEAQPAMMMLENSLYSPIALSLEGKVCQAKLTFKEGASCCVVLASKGYPNFFQTGLPISGIDEAEEMQDVKIFHSATKFEDGKWLTDGGRVLGVTSYSEKGIEEAQRLAYEAVKKINVPGGFHYRTDIAGKVITK